jgi:hypothetical protein
MAYTASRLTLRLAMRAYGHPQIPPQAGENPHWKANSNRSPRYSELSAKRGEIPRTQAKAPRDTGDQRMLFRPCLWAFAGLGPRKSPAAGPGFPRKIPRMVPWDALGGSACLPAAAGGRRGCVISVLDGLLSDLVKCRQACLGECPGGPVAFGSQLFDLARYPDLLEQCVINVPGFANSSCASPKYRWPAATSRAPVAPSAPPEPAYTPHAQDP